MSYRHDTHPLYFFTLQHYFSSHTYIFLIFLRGPLLTLVHTEASLQLGCISQLTIKEYEH